jgi:hypothetical protein
MLNIEVLIAIIDDSEHTPRLDPYRNNRKNNFSTIEQQTRKGAFSFQCDFNIRNGLREFRIINKQGNLLFVNSWSVRIK